MNFKGFVFDFAFTAVITLVVTVVVTFLYSLIVHGTGVVDWDTSFRFALILGIALPWIRSREQRRQEKKV